MTKYIYVGVFSKMFLNYIFTGMIFQLQIKPNFVLCQNSEVGYMKRKGNICFLMQEKHWNMHHKV